jgi:hypothetical protein
VIWEKEAIPNTGVPGNIGGFTTERLIRAQQSASGCVGHLPRLEKRKIGGTGKSSQQHHRDEGFENVVHGV